MEYLLTLRSASVSDIEISFRWVNEPGVRKNSFESEKIIFKNHKNWFLKKLSSNNSYLFIIEKESIPIGQIRFDIENNKAIVDYSIDKKYRGQGFGSILLNMGIQYIINNSKIKPVKSFKAEVKTSNLASIKIFENLGFEKILINNSNKIIFEKLIKN